MEKQSDVNIRNAEENDFKLIYEYVNLLEETDFDTETQKKAFIKNIKNPDFIYLIAEKNNKPIGYLSCHSQYLLHHGGQKIGEIQEMFVDPDYRGNGIGKKLIDKLKKVAKKINVLQLEVTSNKKRIQTHKFYKRENFINSHEKFTFEIK